MYVFFLFAHTVFEGKGGCMKKKIYSALIFLLVFMSFLVYRLYGIATDRGVQEAVSIQSVYQLRVATSRGMIYDCNMDPLVNQTWETVTAIAPTVETVAQLNRQFGDTYKETLAQALENRKPFLLAAAEPVEADHVFSFRVPVRYAADQLAAHVIGYTDSLGNGAAGMELALDDVLGQYKGEIVLDYQVDGLGQVIAGIEPTVKNTLTQQTGGVVLTLDAGIQKLAEEAAAQLGVGAVVVTEVPNGEIRAMVSVPGYTPDTLAQSLESEDAPLINRCFSAYSPGSVFKLVSAAAALEEGQEDFHITCTGTVNVHGMEFGCYGGVAHGKVTLETALEKSCNSYFIRLSNQLGAQSLLRMAYNLGFGVSNEFGRGLYSESGNLPQAETLLSTRALANFSFGQGELTVTPLQIAAMMNTIANGGEYTKLKLVAGTVDDSMRFRAAESPVLDSKERMMQQSTAKTLQKMLIRTVQEGTGKAGKPDNCVAGAKTGTAQTGIYDETGVEKNHFWYSGFISDKTGPRYCITVLRESAVTDGGAAAKVFQEIAEYIGDNIF